MSHSLTNRMSVVRLFAVALLSILIWSRLETARTAAFVPTTDFGGQLTTQHDTWNRMTTINVFSGQQVFFETTHIRVSTNGQYTISLAANGFTPTINVFGGTFFPLTPQVNFWDNGVIGNSQTVFLAGGQEFDIVISTATAGQTGTYTASVSGPAPVTVVPPPPLGILTNPLDATIRPGQTTILQVATQGRPPKTFQWFQGQTGDTSNPVAGATASSFTTPALFADTSYWVRVSDNSTSIDSGTATIFVTAGPITYSSGLSICDDRFNRLLVRTSPGDPIQQSGQIVSYKIFRFRISTPGSYSFRLNTSGFQGVLFLHQGIFIPGNPSVNFFGNSPSGSTTTLTTNLLADGNIMHLVVAQLTPADTGTFTVTVSGPAFVTRIAAPVITTPLQNVAFPRGGIASFSAASPTTNASIQWFRGCPNRTLIPGETTLSYTTPPQTRDEIYTLRLENAGGYETSSATVTILPTAGDINTDAIVQNTTLTVAAPGVLRSATGGDGKTLTAQKVTDPAHGTATLNNNGGFTYRPAVNYSGPDSFTYRVFDGANFSNTATVFLNVIPIFANNTPTGIPDSGTASPYPSTINVSGLGGTITKMRVRLDRMRHENQGNLDILLQGPRGQALILMSDANGDADNPFLFDRVLTFDDAATDTIFDERALFDGVYRPVNYGGGDNFPSPAPTTFNSPAPAGTATFASTFNGTDPNGEWKLFIFDDQGFSSGSLPGWSLTIFTTGGSCPRFTITPAALPEASLNQPFPTTTLAASGGSGIYTFEITSGGLPNGLSFTAEGVLGGTPTQTGAFTFTVTATDQNGCTWQRTYTLNVTCPVIGITPETLPVGTVNQTYSAALGGGGGSGSYTFSRIAGALPSGLTLGGNGALGGTPTQTGVFSFTVLAVDANGCGGTREFTLTINCRTIIVVPPVNNTGLVNAPFSAQFTQSGGTGTTLFSTSSALPNGVTLAGSGTLSGTPTQTGDFPLAVTATDGNGCTGTINYLLTINACPTVTLNSAPLANGNVGASYSQTLTALPAGNYSFTLSGGNLPPGLSLNTGGLISGTPSQTGVFNFRITATGVGGCSGSADFQINVVGCAPITLAPTTLPNGATGAIYNQTLSATPAGAYVFSVGNGALPTGLTLNGNGQLSGTPSRPGTFNFRITALLGACTGSRDYALTIACPTVTLGASLPNGSAGVAYNQSISVAPAANYGFSLISGSLPAGFSLNAANGVISGTAMTAGTFNFTIKAQTANGCAGTQTYSLTINCPAITLSALAAPSLGTAYSQIISATPAGSYSFVVTAGALPAGLSLNAATGLLSGTPTTSGTFAFTITATGFAVCTGSRVYSFTLAGGGCPTITLPELPGGEPGQLYNAAVTANPAGSYSYAVTAGSLPPGLTLFGSFGLLYGFPTTAGTFNFTITATSLGGANNCTGNKSYSLTIGGAATRSPVFGDFDGDRKSDLSVWRGVSGEWLTVNSTDAKLKTEAWGLNAAPYFDLMTPGDYDGDGKMDLAVFRRGTGEWLIKRSSDGVTTAKRWGLATDIPVPGDYDGDGRTDIAVWRGEQTHWYIVKSSDGRTQTVSWGTSLAPYRDVPVPADYDGDGKTDIAVFRQANGRWYIRLSSNNEIVDKAWGLGTDVPVAADYDGDGKADIAVWRGGEMNWYVLRSSDGKVQTISLGATDSVETPVPGDYDGDGKTDAALWREKDGRWTVKYSLDDSVRTRFHGRAGDNPIAIGR